MSTSTTSKATTKKAVSKAAPKKAPVKKPVSKAKAAPAKKPEATKAPVKKTEPKEPVKKISLGKTKAEPKEGSTMQIMMSVLGKKESMLLPTFITNVMSEYTRPSGQVMTESVVLRRLNRYISSGHFKYVK